MEFKLSRGQINFESTSKVFNPDQYLSLGLNLATHQFIEGTYLGRSPFDEDMLGMRIERVQSTSPSEQRAIM